MIELFTSKWLTKWQKEKKTGTLSAVTLRFELEVAGAQTIYQRHLHRRIFQFSFEALHVVFQGKSSKKSKVTLRTSRLSQAGLRLKTSQGQSSPYSCVVTVCSPPRRPQRPGRCAPRCTTDLSVSASLRAHRGLPATTETKPMWVHRQSVAKTKPHCSHLTHLSCELSCKERNKIFSVKPCKAFECFSAAYSPLIVC